MPERPPNDLDRKTRRVVATFLGLLAGFVVGLVGGILFLGLGNGMLTATGICAILAGAICFRWPDPILFAGATILGVFGIDV